jgi:hypothetical protein
VYGLPDDFTLPSFCGARLVQVAVGQHQVQLIFDGNNRSVSIESSYAVVDGTRVTRYTTVIGSWSCDLPGMVWRMADGEFLHCYTAGKVIHWKVV